MKEYKIKKIFSYFICFLDRSYYDDDENDDFNEYLKDDIGESYAAYKKKILKEFAKNQSDSD